MAEHKPLIGISGGAADSKSVLAMMERVREQGGIPVLLAEHAKRDAKTDLPKFDALIFMGNNLDIDPESYGQKPHPQTKSELATEAGRARAKYENELMALALETKTPILGVCGGMQRLNVLCGGTLHQHIPDLPGVVAGHESNEGQAPSTPVVPVEIMPNTKFAEIAKDTTGFFYRSDVAGESPDMRLEMNSFHHQSVDHVGKGLAVSAVSDSYQRTDGSSDRLIEVINADPNGPFAGQYLVGIQGHPEFMPENVITPKLIGSLVKAGQEHARHTGREYQDENHLNAMVVVENWQSGLGIPKNSAGELVTLPPQLPPLPPRAALAR